MRDLELWIEAVSGLPPNCYASIRHGTGPSGGIVGPPIACMPDKATGLGEVGKDDGPIVVDVFQRVGSIRLELPRAGATADAYLAWPGKQDEALKLTAVVVHSSRKSFIQAEKDVRKSFCVDRGALSQASLTSSIVEREASTDDVTSLNPATALSLPNCDQILPYLYLGGVAAADTKALVDQGFRGVVCCMRELEFPTKQWSSDLEYCRVDVEDTSREPIEDYFDEATDFLHSFVVQKKPVLVHCRAGVSRSASVVVAYVMRFCGLSLHDAFFLVRSRRNIITPNLGFMNKLTLYEAEIKNSESSIDLQKYMLWYSMPNRALIPHLHADD